MTDFLAQFSRALEAAGLPPPDSIHDDGQLHRFSTSGKPGDDAGYYVLHTDCVPAGVFGDWRTGIRETWHADLGRKLTFAESEAQRATIQAAQKLRERAETDRRASAATTASSLWKAAKPASDHPYLLRKGVQPHGTRLYRGELVISGMKCDGALIVPLRDHYGTLHSLQFIAGDGQKRFLPGGLKTGCYYAIGAPNGKLLIAEGFATAATLHESTGHAVAVALDAANLMPVAKGIRAKLPSLPLVMCADDDHRTDGNPGLTKAKDAAHAVGGSVAVPEFGDVRPDDATDFNDLYRLSGAEAVARAVSMAKPTEVEKSSTSSANWPPPRAGEPAMLAELALICGDSITPQPVRWVWEGHLAAGKFHVLAGQPGTGKTTLALAFCATITVGGRWPDGHRPTKANCLVWSGEDDPQDTLVPRLHAMGADLRRIHFVGDVREGMDRRTFDPARDVDMLVDAAKKIGDIALLIVDPIVSAVGGDSHKNAETRRSLAPLVDLATILDCAVLGISHFSKGTAGRDPIERVTGSLAFGALARVVLVAAKLKADPEAQGPARMLARAKSNIGPDTGGFGYDLAQIDLTDFPGVSASKVMWGAAMDGTARELLAAAEENDEGDAMAVTPREFLTKLLTGTSMLAKAIFEEADAHGYNKRQMQNAANSLKVNRIKLGMDRGWEWSLPKIPTSTEELEGSNRSNGGFFEPSKIQAVVSSSTFEEPANVRRSEDASNLRLESSVSSVVSSDPTEEI